MKKLFSAITIALLSQPFAANAVIRPGWERPIQKAELVVSSKQGSLAQVQNAVLVFTKLDGQAEATGMQLWLDGVKHDLKIVVSIPTDCGSHMFGAIGEALDGSGQSLKVELVDHSNRLCDDYRPYKWEVRVAHIKMTNPPISLGVLYGSGNSEAVYTIQGNLKGLPDSLLMNNSTGLGAIR